MLDFWSIYCWIDGMKERYGDVSDFDRVAQGMGFMACIILWAYFVLVSYRQKRRFPYSFFIIPLGILFTSVGNLDFGVGDYVVFRCSPLLLLMLFAMVIAAGTGSLSHYYFKVVKGQLLADFVCGACLGLCFGVVLGTLQGPYFVLEPENHLTWLYLLHVIQAALSEELLFRGFLLGYMVRFQIPFGIAVLIQAIVFTLFHSMTYGWAYLGVVLLIGLTTGWVTIRRGSLICAITMHITTNLVVNFLLINR